LSVLRDSIYKYAWDTRCRNVDVAGVLATLTSRGKMILDAGCGEYGVAAFVEAKRVVGVDIPAAGRGTGDFVNGSILDLPFGDRSFEIAVSVDVFEHLPENLRERAVTELVRCAREVVVVAFPAGPKARAMDEEFERKLKAAGEAVPDWLEEHLANPYPDAEQICEVITREANRQGRSAVIKKQFSESLRVAQILRNAASASKYLYLAGNLAAGFLLPVMPRPGGDDAYRTIIVAEFDK
jgi:ubiquinone/menaquinone biosynthesis C-methylase UbiE